MGQGDQKLPMQPMYGPCFRGFRNCEQQPPRLWAWKDGVGAMVLDLTSRHRTLLSDEPIGALCLTIWSGLRQAVILALGCRDAAFTVRSDDA